jgi:hypothetical protein
VFPPEINRAITPLIRAGADRRGAVRASTRWSCRPLLRVIARVELLRLGRCSLCARWWIADMLPVAESRHGPTEHAQGAGRTAENTPDPSGSSQLWIAVLHELPAITHHPEAAPRVLARRASAKQAVDTQLAELVAAASRAQRLSPLRGGRRRQEPVGYGVHGRRAGRDGALRTGRCYPIREAFPLGPLLEAIRRKNARRVRVRTDWH